MALKIKGSYDTEIFTNTDGYVVLKQPGGIGDEDDLVLLTADQLPHVISELQLLWENRHSWDSPTEEAGAEPPTRHTAS